MIGLIFLIMLICIYFSLLILEMWKHFDERLKAVEAEKIDDFWKDWYE